MSSTAAHGAANPLLSAHKSSDGLQVSLHPLPLLEISDYITRSFQRGYKGVLVGALLGEQKGREVTIEHSFTCGVQRKDGRWTLDTQQFSTRLEEMKLVHKSPQLDLVGWYTLVEKYGPTQEHLPIHQQILEVNDSAILLGFHLDQIINPAPGNPLPLTIYESNQEAEDASKDASMEGEDSEMKDLDVASRVALRFRELPYTTETGEAEMIAMQFIREGVANAVVEGSQNAAAKKGKGKATDASEEPAQPVSEDANLTKEELERIAALQTKGNALKMMRDRISLLIAYLESLPPEHGQATSNKTGQASNNILRQIQALVTNLELVTPARQESLKKELQSESNDVKLVSLVTDMLESLADLRNVGKKFAVVEGAKNQRLRQDTKTHGYNDSTPGSGMVGVGDLAL